MASEPTIQTAAKDPALRPQLSGIFVPRAILEDPRLTLLEKLLFGLLDGYAKGELGCFASNGYFSRVFGRTPRAIRGAILNLEAAGLVRRRSAYSFTNPDKKGGLSRREIETVSTYAIRQVQDAARRKKISGGGGRKFPPYNKEILDNPPNPPIGGKRPSRLKKIKLTSKDYGRGF